MNPFLFQFRQVPIYGYSILLLAFLFLFPYLDIRPPHSDELGNGWWVQYMWEHGFYPYNPKYYHGPLYFYLLQLSELLFGFGIWSLRLVNVLFAFGNMILIFMHRRFLGNAVFWAGLVVAVSPGLSFYSRTAIHETGFIFFQLLFSYGFLYFLFNREQKSLFYMLAGMTGLLLTKETWVIFIGTWFIAWGLVCLYGRLVKNELPIKPYAPQRPIQSGDLAFYSLLGVIILLIISSGFLLYPQGLHNSFKGFIPWFYTGTATSGHNKPFFYWLQLLLHYEIIVPSCMAASVAILVGPFVRLARFWAVFALGTFLAYSIIPYKTPWCIQNIIWPYSLVFGILISRLLSLQSGRSILKAIKAAVIIIVIPVMMYSAWLSFHLNFINYAASSEAYNYVQTKKDATLLINTIHTAAQNNPVGENMTISIPLPSPWACSYLLSRYPNVQYVFNNTSPDVLLVSSKDRNQYEKILVGAYLYRNFIVKQYAAPITVYFKYTLFNEWVPEGSNLLKNNAAVHKDTDR